MILLMILLNILITTLLTIFILISIKYIFIFITHNYFLINYLLIHSLNYHSSKIIKNNNLQYSHICILKIIYQLIPLI